MTHTKPRRQSVGFVLENDTPVNSFSINLDPWTGKIQMVVGDSAVKAERVVIEHYYEREKGPKVITRAVADPQDPRMDFTHALSAYDLFFAIDTNTKIVRGAKVSVTAVICGASAPPEIRYKPLGCFEFREVSCPPERLGWAKAIQTHLKSSAYEDGQRCCVIVDAHLGELDGINARHEPILDDFLLPPNFTLDYATADAADNIQNRMLRLADTHSASLLKFIEEQPSEEQIEQSDSPFYKASRWWQIGQG